MYKKIHQAYVVLIFILGSAVARSAFDFGLSAVDNNYIDSNSNENSENNSDLYDDDDDEYDYDYELQCELSEIPPKPESMCCGFDVSSNNRIVGGAPTLLNQYPWLALIEYKLKGNGKMFPKCGGSLISSLYVLTAAHCVTGKILKRSTPHNVILGDYDKYHDGKDCIKEPTGQVICSDGEIRIAIEKNIPHPLFEEKIFLNDIALVKLKEMAPYTDSVRPICLPAADITLTAHKNLWLVAAGWGVMKQVKDGNKTISTSSQFKRHLRVPYVPLDTCKKSWKVTKTNICAGGLKGQDTCMGDSGGPLMFNKDGQFELTGAVSFGAGEPCGMKNIPGAYTNVYRYKDWVMNVITENQKQDQNVWFSSVLS